MTTTSAAATSPTPVLSGTTAAAGNQQVGSGLASLTSNFQTFLSLLTTQLKNQDPLSPIDSNAFTQQLVQMSGVQQQLLTNSLLTTLVGQGNGGLAAGVNYIGKSVSAQATSTSLSGGQAKWSYELASNASNVQLEIDNAAGQAVWSGGAPSAGAGVHDFTWNGKDANGRQLADGGVYTLKVKAVAADQTTSIASQVLIRGTVTGVQMINDAPYLSIGSSVVPLSGVIGVQGVGS